MVDFKAPNVWYRHKICESRNCSDKKIAKKSYGAETSLTRLELVLAFKGKVNWFTEKVAIRKKRQNFALVLWHSIYYWLF
jgi:hypothetical protein